MGQHKVEIDLDAAGKGRVEVDGHKLAVREVAVNAAVGRPPTVTLTLVDVDVRLGVEALPTLCLPTRTVEGVD